VAYKLNPGERLPLAIKRVLREELDSAIASLGQATGKERDSPIHEARKSIKKIRGVLRLIQPEIGRRIFSRENDRFRKIAHTLSELRDAGAMIEIFDALITHEEGEQRELAPAVLALRKHLVAEKRRMERSAQVGKVLGKAIAALEAARKRLDSLPLKKEGWNAIAPGLRRSYRKGRKVLAVVQRDGTADSFHRLRKRVKDHWYHIRLLDPPAAGDGAAYERSLKDLETWLGDDHNLTVLREKLTNSPVDGAIQGIEAVTNLAESYGQDLRIKASELGERVYRPKPKQVTKDCARLWLPREEESAANSAILATRKSSTSAKIVHPSRHKRAS